jgi:hypothetical protein
MQVSWWYACDSKIMCVPDDAMLVSVWNTTETQLQAQVLIS